ncbi:hypothetical protein ACLMJK_000637 [Lecanora helva]
MARRIYAIDQGWTLKQADDVSSEFLPVAQFPTTVHLDLLHHGLIPDPNIGMNENTVQWVGEKSWLYRTAFQNPKTPTQKAVLAFDGLDTHATVRLNGVIILKTQSMFIPERVDVTNSLSTDDEELNVLEITFESTYLIGKRLVERNPDHYWGCWNGDPSRLAVRKAQYHYGWDWGPTLLTCGPWRPISLETYTARISDLSFATNVCKSLKTAEILATAEIEGIAEEVMFTITYDGREIAREVVTVDENGIATTTFRAQSPKLWYPHSYGAQPLHLLTATLVQEKTPLDVCEKRFGLRRVEVVQRKLKDDCGTSFYFEVNNIPIFCGGSNWIPADSFIPRITSRRYRDWVRMAVQSNQIMLRVWGGGIYEEQAFYDACDEMGVLIWQDFMFACGNYPANPEFLNLVRREAISNIKRLRHHPSIVLFAGNNEDYQYCETENLDYDPHDHDPESWLRSSFPARYIYEKILAEATSSLVPGTYYHFGSPYGGKTSADPTVGDIHQWNIWHGTQEPYQNFPYLSGGFVTEFGMQGLPSMKTLNDFLPGEENPDRYALSSTIDFHNKADGHTRRIAMYMNENIRYSFEPLETYVYHTQLMQAECVSTAYRSFKRKWKGPGKEECAGALVWQLNDCWPGTSWAIMDYSLRSKLSFYAIKRELQPLTIGLQRTVKTIPADQYTRAYVRTVHKCEMWAVNLSLETQDVYLTIHSFDLTTNKRTTVTGQPKTTQLLPNRSTELTNFEIPGSGEDSDKANQTVIAAYLHDRSGKQLARAVNWPEPLKWVHMPKSGKIDIKLVGGGSELSSDEPRAISLSADVCIKGLQLECKGKECVVFEDNGVDVVPGEEVIVSAEGLRVGDEGNLVVKYLGMGD